MNVHKDAVKAGAYVYYEGRFVFMFGWNHLHESINVVRLGGHREPGETAAQCAVREVWEESNVKASIFDAPKTIVGDGLENTPTTHPLEHPRPVWIRQQDGAETGKWLAMYLAYGQGNIKPSMETQGLICFDKNSLHVLCEGSATLKILRGAGAVVHLAVPLPEDGFLTPTPQVHFLNRLLNENPEWLSAFLNSW